MVWGTFFDVVEFKVDSGVVSHRLEWMDVRDSETVIFTRNLEISNFQCIKLEKIYDELRINNRVSS